jgi:hypothetical protein
MPTAKILFGAFFFLRQTLTTQNKELAKKLLQGIPQLPKALFQVRFAESDCAINQSFICCSYCTWSKNYIINYISRLWSL